MTKPMTQEEKQQAYDAWFIAEVDKGIADDDAGNVLSDEEATAHMEKFFAKLVKESRKAA